MLPIFSVPYYLAEAEAKKKRAACSKSIQKGERKFLCFLNSFFIFLQEVEYARIHANDAIRKKNEALNYTKLAARIDGYAIIIIVIIYYLLLINIFCYL